MKKLFAAAAAMTMTGAAYAETMNVQTALAVYEAVSSASSICARQLDYQPKSDTLLGKDCSNFFDVLLPKFELANYYYYNNPSSFKEHELVIISVLVDNIEKNLSKIIIHSEGIAQ